MGIASAKQVVCPQMRMRLMSAIVDGTGTAALGGICANNMSLTDNGTGDYTLTFDLPYQQAPQVLATPVTDNIVCKVTSALVGSVRILTENLSGVATDADFHVVIIGSDSQDQI
jgi:hypothetical protein